MLTDLAYSQKPASFKNEEEFRFCIVALGERYLSHFNTETHLNIDLGKRAPYLELM